MAFGITATRFDRERYTRYKQLIASMAEAEALLIVRSTSAVAQDQGWV